VVEHLGQLARHPLDLGITQLEPCQTRDV